MDGIGRVIVQKYGGSSVATLEKLEAVAERVVRRHSEGYGVVVVVSAMGNRTDELLELVSRISAEPPARELDMLLSTGERVTMALLSIAISKRGVDAISFTGSQSGIITNDSHSNARIIQVRPYRIQDELARGRIVIVAGFQGTSYRNEITTLGRGGSDMTAVALAGALGAEACEIYSDVDGVYTADPKVVPDAERLDSLSSAEMLEMSLHGAKVLHDEAVRYAHVHGIALYAKKAHGGADDVGTLVRPDGWPGYALEASEVRAGAVVSARKSAYCEGDVRLFDVLGSEPGVRVMCMACASGRGAAVLDVWNCSDGCAGLVRALERNGGVLRPGVGGVTLTGADIGRRGSFVSLARGALAGAGIGVEASFLSPNAVTFAVGQPDVAEASRVLHGACVLRGGRGGRCGLSASEN